MTAIVHERSSERLQVIPAETYRETPTSSRLLTPIPICQVMVPLSGAPLFERALPHAVGVAVASGARVSLVFVETPEGQAERGSLDTTAMNPARYLAELRAQLGLRVSEVNTRIVQAATPARGYADAECRDGVDLVVLALEQPTDAARYEIDNLAQELIRHSYAPVLLIPPETLPPSESVRVLVPLDGSGRAEYALFPIIALSNASRGQYIREITLLMACEEQEAMGDATTYLEGVRTSLGRLMAPMIRTHAEVVEGRAGRVIAKLVSGRATRRFDMLAMTTRGQGGYGRTLFGGGANYVLSHTDVPTLVVNPR